MDIKLNFVNRSNDANNSEIVIFQKNVAANFEELSVAWKVIKYCGRGDNHPFSYPMDMYVSASDSYGNFMPQMLAENGQRFGVSLTASGDTLGLLGAGTSSKEVQVLNNLQTGSINANIYKDGKLRATKASCPATLALSASFSCPAAA